MALFLLILLRKENIAVICRLFNSNFRYVYTQVGFAELKETTDGRADVSGTIIGAPIVGKQLAQYSILTDHQDADCRPMIRLILSRGL